jgi:hypothetical protein
MHPLLSYVMIRLVNLAAAISDLILLEIGCVTVVFWGLWWCLGLLSKEMERVVTGQFVYEIMFIDMVRAHTGGGCWPTECGRYSNSRPLYIEFVTCVQDFNSLCSTARKDGLNLLRKNSYRHIATGKFLACIVNDEMGLKVGSDGSQSGIRPIMCIVMRIARLKRLIEVTAMNENIFHPRCGNNVILERVIVIYLLHYQWVVIS